MVWFSAAHEVQVHAQTPCAWCLRTTSCRCFALLLCRPHPTSEHASAGCGLLPALDQLCLVEDKPRRLFAGKLRGQAEVVYSRCMAADDQDHQKAARAQALLEAVVAEIQALPGRRHGEQGRLDRTCDALFWAATVVCVDATRSALVVECCKD